MAETGDVAQNAKKMSDVQVLEKELSSGGQEAVSDAAPRKSWLSSFTGRIGKKNAAKSAGQPAGPRSKSKLAWTLRLELKIEELLGQMSDVIKGLVSRDAPTRKMSLFFLVSL